MDKKEIQSVWAAYLEVQEAKHKKNEKMDPVGQEDGDIDNDGDKDSSDEYLAKRRKAVGKAMKKDDEKDVKESEESPYPSLDKKKREKKGSNLEPANTPSDKLKGESVEEASCDSKTRKENDEEGEKVDCPKCKGKGCGHCDDKGYHMKEDYEYFVENLSDEELDDYTDWLNEEEQLDELSPQLKQRAAAAAQQKAQHHQKMASQRHSASDRVVNKHGGSGYGKSKHDRVSNKLSNSGYAHDSAARKRSRQAQKFSASAKKEAFEIIDQVLEMRQRARLESVLSSSELAALEEKAKHVGTKGPEPAPAEEFMSTNSASEKKTFADHEAGSDKKLEDYEEMGEMDAAKAGKGGPSQSAPRRGDNLKVGDNAMPTPKKAKGQ